MIQNEHDLYQAHEALGDLYKALASLREEIADSNPNAFCLLAEGPLHEIRSIQSEIEEFAGIHIVEHEEAPLWLRLVGPKARWGETPASVLTSFLDSLRKGVQGIAGFNATGRIGGRPPIDLQIACDVELVGFASGSFQVGMRLPDPEQAELFPSGYWQYAKKALTDYLEVAEWAASSSSVQELEEKFQDAAKRRVVLRALKPFIPRRLGGIEFVELTGHAIPGRRRIHITQEASARITEAFELAVSEEEEHYEGDIREIDLDRRTFHLRHVQEVNDVLCRFGEELVPIATELLGKRVRVIGVRTPTIESIKGALEIIDLDKIEQKPTKDGA